MNAGLRAQLGSELEPRGWDPANYEKLLDFLVKYARENPARPVKWPMAIFDADHTTWTGDLGDATFVYLAKNLKLSPRLHELLPASIDVPASGYGVTAGGRLFAAARVRESLDVMLGAYREAMAKTASMADFLTAFSEDWALPGGPLFENTRFVNAHATYQGVLLAVYNLLDEKGRVTFDFSDARVVTSLYGDIIRNFYGWETTLGPKRLARFARPTEGGQTDILFPRILDAGADQQARRTAAGLGSYTQVATWVALDKSPDELRSLALEVWDWSPGLDVPHAVIFPVDAALADAPAPLDFAVERSRFALGASPAEGVVLGTTSMEYGTAVREEIVNLMAVMARHDITPIVISASQTDLVHSVLQRVYSFGASPMAGMRHRMYEGLYRAHTLAPVTFRPGKVDAAREIARRLAGSDDVRPVFSAGDSDTDLEFVAYSSDYRLFFDRKKALFMSLASYLSSHGALGTTLIQKPFEAA